MSEVNIWIVDCNKLRGDESRLSEVDVSVVLVSDFNAERALRLEAERQVGELREQLASEEAVHSVMVEILQAKLDTAMGMLRRASHEYEHGHLKEHHQAMVDISEFINTTSTEGNGHDSK